MTYFAINKFGKSMNVYSDTGHKNKIGTIGNREAFVVMKENLISRLEVLT